MAYNFRTAEKSWQKKWKDAGIFKADDRSKKKKFYCLEMLPYPSGYGLHMGHARNYSIGDSYARFRRMRGFNVIYPIGWDSFGLPTENEAIKRGVHPIKSIQENIKIMKTQMSAMGFSYDWSREIASHEPEYYKWDQWLFLKLFENGLVYRKRAPGNWCPNCRTTLANEDVKAGRCWRCDSEVIQKELEQWFVKITDYADALLEGLDKIEFSPRLKALQKNWIGRSKGIEIYFTESKTKEILPVFTTRPDTLFGCTFVVFAPEHPKVKEFTAGTKYEKEVKKFLERTKKLSELDRISKEKDGLFIGRYAVNPVNGKRIPVYIANFVLLSYGTGMIMAVPAHDQRDFEFAKKYGIPIETVIHPQEGKPDPNKAYTENGIMVNSRRFNGLQNVAAIKKISDWLVKEGKAGRVTNYKIRDWNISRQRYWGAPIPVIYCDRCGAVPVPEKDLPVRLPLKVSFSKKGAAPLATNKGFVNAKCPECRSAGKREVDTMTTFVDSSWYFLRYCDPKNNRQIFDKNKVKYWMPVDQYIGGIEHAVGHLMYSRFITRFLKKLGYVYFDEPFLKLLNHGMVNLGGVKMSKSKGNVVDPLDIVKKYGADTLRTYLLFIAQPDTPIEWSEKEVIGIHKFITKVSSMHTLKEGKKKAWIESICQKKIQKITEYTEELQFNKSLIELIDFSNKIERIPSRYAVKVFIQMLAPFAPHLCEEVWHKLGEKGLAAASSWPKVDKKKIDSRAEKVEEAVDNLITDIKHITSIVKKKPKHICIYAIPPEVRQYQDAEKDISREFGARVNVYAVNDSQKHDPAGKAGKAKPGRPAIYVE